MNESSSELRLEDINPLVKNYEILIVSLTEQLGYYKEEQDHLKNEILALLHENRQLSSHIKEYLENQETSATSNVANRFSQADIVDNLQGQINLLTKEKESAVDLWRNSLSTIDQLEDELRLYEGRTHGYISKTEVHKIKSGYDKQIKELETELLKTRRSLAETEKSSKSLIEEKINELQKTTETHKDTLKTVEKLEYELNKVQEEQQGIIKMRDELKSTLHIKDMEINELKFKDKESKCKVNEAVQIVEVALMEKDAALIRENQAKDELTTISKVLSDVIDETNDKLKRELETTRQLYNEKYERVQKDSQTIMDELKSKEIELDKHKNKSKMLEDELEIIRRGNVRIDESSTTKLLILEKNLESTFQKLILSEKRNIQLEADRESIREDLDQMAKHFEQDIRAREVEKRTLQQKISSLQNELELSNSGLMDVAAKVVGVNAKIAMIEKELKTQLYLKDVNTEKLLSSKIKEIESGNAIINKDLQNRLESQINFNKKWKAEVKDITDKLEKRLLELRKEVCDLKKLNKQLSVKLNESENQSQIYKDHLKSLCLGVTTVAALSKKQNAAVLSRDLENVHGDKQISPEKKNEQT